MATREASIKVTMKSGDFMSGLREIKNKAKKTGSEAGTSMGVSMKRSFKAGLKGAGDEMKAIGSDFKNTMKNAATLGAGLVGGAMVAKVMEAENAYISLSANVRDAAGNLITMTEAQNLVTEAANNTKTTLGQTREVAAQLAKIGPPEKIVSFTERALMQAKRLGVENTIVARTYSRLEAKGLVKTADEAERLVETMSEFGRTVLGVDPDEAIDPNDMAEFAAFANTTGMEVGKLTALLGKTGSTVKDMGQAFEVVEELGLVLNTRKGLTEIGKAAGLSEKTINGLLAQGNSLDSLIAVMNEGPKAVRKMYEAMGTDRAKQALGELLGKDLMLDFRTGDLTKETLEIRANELAEEINSAADDTQRVAEIQKKNAEILTAKSGNITVALNKLETAFGKPEMMSAIDRLTKMLPELADKFAKLMEWVLNNPMLAGGAYVGGRVGLSFAGSTLNDLGSKAGNAIMENMGPTLTSKAGSAGTAMGKAAHVALIAGAAVLGWQIGSKIADAYGDRLDENQKKTGGLDIQSANVAQGAGSEATRKALDLKMQQLRELEGAHKGPMGAVDVVFDMLAKATGQLDKGEGVVERRRDQILQVEQEAIALQKELDRRVEQESIAAESVKKFGSAVGNLTNMINTAAAGGSGGSSGDAPGGLSVAPGHGKG